MDRSYFLTLINVGPIVRIAPNEYSIDDPAAAKAIYGSGRGFVKVSQPDRYLV